MILKLSCARNGPGSDAICRIRVHTQRSQIDAVNNPYILQRGTFAVHSPYGPVAARLCWDFVGLSLKLPRIVCTKPPSFGEIRHIRVHPQNSQAGSFAGVMLQEYATGQDSRVLSINIYLSRPR